MAAAASPSSPLNCKRQQQQQMRISLSVSLLLCVCARARQRPLRDLLHSINQDLTLFVSHLVLCCKVDGDLAWHLDIPSQAVLVREGVLFKYHAVAAIFLANERAHTLARARSSTSTIGQQDVSDIELYCGLTHVTAVELEHLVHPGPCGDI